MIKLEQPSMVLNAEGVPGPYYKMWNSWTVPPAAKPADIMAWVASVAGSAPLTEGGFNLVINCHGANARLGLGTGFGWAQLPLFTLLAPSVSTIYLVACNVVSFSGSGDGNLFCGAMAKNAAARVISSNHTQTTGALPTIPYGCIDGFEGDVWMWHPDGSNELTEL